MVSQRPSPEVLPAKDVLFGHAAIDRVRGEVRLRPTDGKTLEERLALLYLWGRLLGVLGGKATHLYAARERLPGGPGMTVDDAALAAVDEGYAAAERCFAELVADADGVFPSPGRTVRGGNRSASGDAREERATDWALFHADHGQTGYTPDRGPGRGTLAWRAPIGHAWYARIAVADGRVYAPSPGMSSSAMCFEERTGDTVWVTRQVAAHPYTVPRVASSVVLHEGHVVVRESGSGGNTGSARSLQLIDRSTGKLTRRVPVGHVDYRTGYAVLVSAGRWLLCSTGSVHIQQRPPVINEQDTLACLDAETMEVCWRLRVGPLYGEPVSDGASAFCATRDGRVYGIDLDGQRRVRWTVQLGAEVTSSPVLHDGRLYVGARDGSVTCLGAVDGTVYWRSDAEHPEARAFALFSTPTVLSDLLLVGTARGALVCLDTSDGTVLWRHALPDWVRARPTTLVGTADVVVATLNGSIHRLTASRDGCREVWSVRPAEHAIFADPVAGEGVMFVTSSDLRLLAVGVEAGEVRWRRSLIECVEHGGERIAAEFLGGGANFQSSPAVVGDRVMVGGPDRFVRAYDRITGAERWRFETSAQVCAAPVAADGRVFFGQQGGTMDFSCVSAETGEPLWSRPLGWVWASVTLVGDRVLVPGVDGVLSAVSAGDGELFWRYETNGGLYPSPAVENGFVFVGSWDGYFSAVDVESGRLHWAFSFPGVPDSGAVLVDGGRVYVHGLTNASSGGTGRFYCLDAHSGAALWARDLPGRVYNASPAFHDGRLYISAFDGRRPGLYVRGCRVWCVDAARPAGPPTWEHAGGGLTGVALSGDGRAYFGSTESGFFTCVDAMGNGDGTTSEIWRYRMEAPLEESCPAVAGGRAYVLSSDRHLYAFE